MKNKTAQQETNQEEKPKKKLKANNDKSEAEPAVTEDDVQYSPSPSNRKNSNSEAPSNINNISVPKIDPSSSESLSNVKSSSPMTFDIGSTHWVIWKGVPHQASIVEKRQIHSSNAYEYYVHYISYDRRLDEWVESSRIDPPEWMNKPEVKEKPPQSTPNEKKMTRNMKRVYEQVHNLQKSMEHVDPHMAQLEKEHEEVTKVKYIESIEFGDYALSAWYYSPFPEEYRFEKKLYVCEFCIKYMKYPQSMKQHKDICQRRSPPGKEIYRKDNIVIHEIDGKEEKLYCQNMCLMAKLFLDHKTLYYDVEPFLFYILTEIEKKEDDKEIQHVVGYFSKEKNSFDEYNLSCILILPQHQRKGYGRLLIEFSYELSKLENKIGSPERPLSDLGLVGYKSYWSSVLLDILHSFRGTLSIKDLSHMTSIRKEDIIQTLSSMNLTRYWKGQHVICVTPRDIEEFLRLHPNVKLGKSVDSSCLVNWEPWNKKK